MGLNSKTLGNYGLLLAVLTLAACTWVRPDTGADEVLVLPKERVADCERLGSVEVSVLARVVGMDRHEEEVESDLQVLARNHAVERGGDTVVPLSEIKDGEQRYGIYSCQGNQAGEGEPEADEDEEEGVTVQQYNG
ncbi:hypothetical protein J2T60_002382 [Natronospira proteinivora]|uniref:DUF4156 domain-containing protein n=1 Tax=Natronospira proteinivora TaxID=1807133 RepID=A0ABT1GBE5_9GAMM|nr:DUF4156 domain-containing protein [Natronospira proteinivora]MCP1728382.1 hypothetical protein [Natronospira proteinivora]